MGRLKVEAVNLSLILRGVPASRANTEPILESHKTCLKLLGLMPFFWRKVVIFVPS